MVSYQSVRDEIKRAADIVALIGEHVQLKKAGRNYIGLCPFHAEKDPSFTVNPERQTFHCFGCKKGGDVFSFWMEYHSLTFPEALRDLAERYHVMISEGVSGHKEKEKADRRDALFEINEKAAAYYQGILNHPDKGRAARDYLTRRSVSRETVVEFRLGHATDEWDGLTQWLGRHHQDLKMAVEAGLIIGKKSGGHYDRFRGRIVFPIVDLRQRVVGFGGRVLDDALPKYLNTPETSLFRKGELLYGLNLSFRAIRDKGRAAIVEGYMDCLALRNHGLDEVVATLGTALTDRHVRKLKGYAREAIVIFDSDAAGKAAALKSLPVFLKEGLSARAVALPDGYDPDSFVNENGLDRFLGLLEDASPLFDFFLEQKLTQGDSDEEKVQVLKDIVPILSQVSHSPLCSLYVQRLSDKTNINEAVIWSEVQSYEKNPSRIAVEKDLKERLNVQKAGKRISDFQILSLVVYYPQAVPRLIDADCNLLLSDPVVVEIVNTIFEKYREGDFLPEELLETLDNPVACELLREILHRPSIYSDQDVEQAVAEFEEEAYQTKISASLASFRKGKGDAETLNQLLKLKRRKGRQDLDSKKASRREEYNG